MQQEWAAYSFNYPLVLNYVMFMLISKEPIIVADLQILANQLANAEWRIGDGCFSGIKKNFGRLIKQEAF